MADGHIIIDTSIDNSGLEDDLKETRRDIDEAGAKLTVEIDTSQAEKNLAQLRADLEALNNAADADAQRGILENAMDRDGEAIDAVNARIVELREELKNLGDVDAYGESAEHAAALRAEIDQLTAQSGELESNYGQLADLFERIEATGARVRVDIDEGDAARVADTVEAAIEDAGTVDVPVDVDTEDVPQQLSDLSHELESEDVSVDVPVDLDADEAAARLKMLTRDINRYTGKLATIRDSRGLLEASMERDGAAIDKVNGRIVELRARLKQLRDTDPENGDAWHAAQREAAGLEAQIEALCEQSGKMEAAYSKQADKLEELSHKADYYKQAIADAKREADALAPALDKSGQEQQKAEKSASGMSARLASVKAAAAGLFAGIANGAKAAFAGVAKVVSGSWGGIKKGAKAAFAGAVKVARAAFKAIRNVAAGAARSIGNAFKAPLDFIGRGLRRIGKMFAGVFLFNIINAGFREMRDYIADVISRNAEATQAIARLRGALATLAEPLVRVVLPVFVQLVNFATTLVAKIARVVSGMLGIDFGDAKGAAEAASAYEDEADAVRDVGEATKEAEKYLAGFDELNVMGADDAEAAKADEIAKAKETAFDFDEASKNLGMFDGLLDKLDKLAAWFKSTKIPDDIARIIDDIKRLFAALLDGDIAGVWGALKDLIIDNLWLINDAIDLVLDAIDDATGGRFHDIIEGVKLALDGLVLMVDGLINGDFETWKQGVTLFFEGIEQAINGFLTFLDEITGGQFHDAIEGLKEIVSGLSSVLQGVLTGDLGMIQDGLVQIVQGIEDTINGLLTWLDNATGGQFHEIIASVQDAVTGLSEIIQGILTGDYELILKGLADVAQAVADFLGNLATSLLDAVKTMWTNFWNYLGEKFPELKGFFDGIRDVGLAILDVFTGAIDSIWQLVSGVIDDVHQIVGGLFDFFVGLLTGDNSKIEAGLKGIGNGIIGAIGHAISGVINFILDILNGAIGALNVIPGVDIPKFEHVNIELPKLATGAVIPPNGEFAAILGDQTHGRNLEAPESLMRQIVREESGGGNAVLLQQILDAIKDGQVIKVDGRTLGQTVTQYQTRRAYMAG